MAPIVPPIKCQGIKTKIVHAIKSLQPQVSCGRWIEPFCGSCVVPLNIRPQRALLCDSNEHIIRFYSDLQSGEISGGSIREYLEDQGARLKHHGETVYYEIRDQFNQTPNSHAFVFLNRACFNGVMRFNRKGKFNVPFCRKPERFSKAYITKIMNQVSATARIFRTVDWVFQTADFRQTLGQAVDNDVVYADPPYAGRHVDYYNSWSEEDERDLVLVLKKLPCRFVLSTWYQNKFRTNPRIGNEWSTGEFTINQFEHFYHVGPTEDLRHSMMEALISNFPGVVERKRPKRTPQLGLFDLFDGNSVLDDCTARKAEPDAAADGGRDSGFS